jgi:leucyl-tRNA synthetase
MHLLYTRFWTKVMADAGVIPFREPFPVLRSQGVMHARDPKTGEVTRMSKSRGNVVTPDSVAETHGADALRVYLLFMAPFENNTVWEEEGIAGAERFLQRVWRLADQVIASQPTNQPTTRLTTQLHQTIQRVTADVEAFKFNTAIAALMELLSAMSAHRYEHGVTAELAEAIHTYVLLLAPFAPHIAEELWERMGEPYSVHQQPWPAWDAALAAEEMVTLVVQVNGKVRARIEVSADIEEKAAKDAALADENVQHYVSGKEIRKVIYVPGPLINIVAR